MHTFEVQTTEQTFVREEPRGHKVKNLEVSETHFLSKVNAQKL